MKGKVILYLSIATLICSCRTSGSGQPARESTPNQTVSATTGADRMDTYLAHITGKRVAIVANQTSRIEETHLVDTLLSLGIHIVKVFAPEHGFRGNAGAGETIRDGKDSATGLPVISLYGKTKKPLPSHLSDVDVLLFDIQDVGTRFYTYISTMHYVMEAAAESGKEVIILDRPNPNGRYIDGPVLLPPFKSFVGMHPIPVVHGCTVGELALMINGEGWLENGVKCDLLIIPCGNYRHSDFWHLPVPPSPNLPNDRAIELYPSLCFFEGTVVSVGRGTNLPFQSIGYPGNTWGDFEFTPRDVPGAATDPPHENQVCRGFNLAASGEKKDNHTDHLDLHWLIGMYNASFSKESFFTEPAFFDKLAGNAELREMIIAGKTEEEIRASWAGDLAGYKSIRRKYLLYPD